MTLWYPDVIILCLPISSSLDLILPHCSGIGNSKQNGLVTTAGIDISAYRCRIEYGVTAFSEKGSVEQIIQA